MTEDEWLASTDPDAMGEVVARRKRASPRVLRLYCAAYWSWCAGRFRAKADREEMLAAVALLEEWAETGAEPDDQSGTPYVFWQDDARMAFGVTTRIAVQDDKPRHRSAARAVWALRELFGNPFTTPRSKSRTRRGWMLDPLWRTDTAVALARKMYESRDFGAMPILADALQDAGCDNDDILNHCRGPGPHVRGCWVVDLVLGKE